MAVVVEAKSNSDLNPDFLEDIKQASLKAQKNGGVIEVIQYANDQTSVVYCFLNVAEAA